MGTLAASASAQKEQTNQQMVNFVPPHQYQAPTSNVFTSNPSISHNAQNQNQAAANSSTSPLSSTLAFLQNMNQNMHGEQASLPIAAAGQGQQQYALFSEQNAAHVQDENIENLR